MHFIRAMIVVLILLAAMPAAAQDPSPEPGRRREVPQVRTLITSYSGVFGRFIYGRPGAVWTGVHPRLAWVVDEFIDEGRPLGFSPTAFRNARYARPQPSWTGWPYSVGGQDVASKESPKAEAEAALAEGRALWKAADYAGALAAYKKAVAHDLKNAGARFHMALALLVSGDLRNADKALASALDVVRGPEELPSLGADAFRNPKERAKFESKLFASGDGTGAITVALAQHLLGLKEKAAKTLESSKNPAAGKLAELIR